MPARRLPYVLIGIVIGVMVAWGLLASTRPPATTVTSTATITETRSLTTSITSTATLRQTITETESLISTLLTTTSVTSTVTLSQVKALCFSKPERCDDLVISLLDGAKKSIHVAVYSFTSDALAEALIRAKERGVEVRVVMEEEQAGVRGSEYARLRAAGIGLRIDGNPYLMHHKFAVIDGVTVIVGSYNWTAAAEERNDEDLLIIEDLAIAKRFEQEFERLWEEAA